MITKDRIYQRLLELIPHTETNIRLHQCKIIPEFNSGIILNSFKYHYDDRWYGNRYSIEEPDAAYGVLKVSNLPFKSKFKRRSNMEFSGSIERLIYADEIVPFLLFVNNRFVSWDKIDLLHNCKDDYLLIHGEQFNYYHNKKMDMLVVPFGITCISKESDYLFERNYAAITEYINASATVDANNKLRIRIPDYMTDYKYNGIHISIGAWMYRQLILRSMGLLEDARFKKLSRLPVEKYKYNVNGEQELAFSSTVNLFDIDSYHWSVYDSLLEVVDPSRIIFQFNDYGELVEEDASIFVLSLDTAPIDLEEVISDKTIVSGTSKFTYNTLFKENYIVFKDGKLCTDCAVDLSHANTYRIDTTESVNYRIDGTNTSFAEDARVVCKIFNNKRQNNVINNYQKFLNRSYVSTESIKYLNNEEDAKKYLKDEFGNLDFTFGNNIPLEENIDNALEKVIEYDAGILNPIYKSNIYSSCITGKDFNESLETTGPYDAAYWLKIPRSLYEHNQTYVMIFINGILIDIYDEMLIYQDHFLFPVSNLCQDSDTVELLYFTNCNNNELPFTYDKTHTHEIYEPIIPSEELKLFSTDVADALVYDVFSYDLDEISFPVYEREDGKTVVFDPDLMDGKELIAVSERRFIYERLYIDQKAYKIRLDKRFRYCDNQKQFVVFINGRRILDTYFLVTIPKLSRPFDAMYLYLTKFVTPEDRIEVFYLPQELNNINTELPENQALQYTLQFPLTGANSYLNTNGYIKTKIRLPMPINNETYLFFINGKKIPKTWLQNINTNTLRVLKDTLATNDLIINKTTDESIDEVVDFINEKQSKLDILTNGILEDTTLGATEMDKLQGCYVQMSNTEDNYMKKNVGKIAIINEIVRDFWVTSGYDYQANPFVYDYYTDEFKFQDENGIWISPALDALPYDNIMKDSLHHLFFGFMDNMPEYFEIGTVIQTPTFVWEYNTNYDTEELVYQKLDDVDIPVEERSYTLNENISSDRSFVMESFDGYGTCKSTLNVRFANSIYYGLVDEDFMDGNESDVLSTHPEELFNQLNLGDHVIELNQVTKPTIRLDLVDYVIGNTNYFVVAIPKRLVIDENGNNLISFYLPDITTEEFKAQNMDDKTTPIYTNGKFDKETNTLIDLKVFKMERFMGNFDGVFTHKNAHNYSEEYVIYKSTGFFTRLYNDTKFTIRIR